MSDVNQTINERLQAILAEHLETLEAGQSPNKELLVHRDPDLADDLRELFADAQRLKAMVAAIRLATQPAKRPSADIDAFPPTPGPLHSGNAETLGVEQSTAQVGTRIRYFGDYELLAELGRGGMGVVYKAKQTTLNRFVALKLILAGTLASPQDVERFRREADAAASLDHPHITPIFEVGEHEGQQFFSMRLIEGSTLTERLPTLKGNQRQIAKLLVTLSRAVHHAHQRGTLHRDLKPANVLIDESGEPQITDFGLARRVHEDSELTQSGSIVGTPSYMAPEQAQGIRVLTTGVDVYSLGAIFYHALTGSPPFTGTSPLDVLHKVVETEPARPSVSNARVDRDLETICLKCLEKQPARRYESAAALAEDLERWLRHEPIAARTSGPFRRAGKWVRRHPAATAIVCLALGGVATVAWQWRSAVSATKRAEHELQRNRLALADRDSANGAMLSARQWLLDVPPERRGWEWNCLWQLSYISPGNRLPKQASLILGVKVLPEKGELITLQHDGTLQSWDLATLNLVRERSVWKKPVEFGFDEPICHDFSRGGRFLAFGNEGKSDFKTVRSPLIKVVNLETGEVLFTQERRSVKLALTADGSMLYAICEVSPLPDRRESIVAWNVTTGERVFEIDRPLVHFSYWERLFVTADGKKLYDLGGQRVYSAQDGELMEEFSISPAPSSNWNYRSPLAMSDDERISAWALEHTGSGNLLLRDNSSHESHQIPTTFKVTSAAFSSDARYVAATVVEPNWDVEAIGLKNALPMIGPMKSMAAESHPYVSRVYVYDARDGRVVRSFRGFSGWVLGLRFCNDDRQLLAFGGELAKPDYGILETRGDVVIYDLTHTGTGRMLALQNGGVCDVSISADSELLAAGCNNGQVHIWNLSTGQQIRTFELRTNGTSNNVPFGPDANVFVAFAPTASFLAVSGNQMLRVVDAATGEEKWSAPMESSNGRVTWDPNGKRVVRNDAGGAAVIDAETGKHLHKMEGYGPVIFSPDGRFIARPTVHDIKGALAVFEAASGRELFRAETKQAPAIFSTGYGLFDAAFSPDGGAVVGVGNNGPGLAFQVPTGRKMFELQRHDQRLWCVSFSPDGSRIATGGSDGSVRLWDAATGEELHAFRGHDQAVSDVLFSPDGTRLVSGGRDGEIMIWEASK